MNVRTCRALHKKRRKKFLCKIHIALLSPIIMSLLLLSFLPLRLMINASTSYTSDNKTFLKNVGQEYRAFSSSDFPFWRKFRPWRTKCIYMVTQPTESVLEEVCMHEKRKQERLIFWFFPSLLLSLSHITIFLQLVNDATTERKMRSWLTQFCYN